MDVKIVWICTHCKKENEDNLIEIVYCGGEPRVMYIPLQCTTCGHIDRYRYEEDSLLAIR